MNTLEAIAKRRSYRGPYKPDPVSREDLTAIMQAGLDAPSGSNKQSTSLIAVDDPAILRQLYDILLPAAATPAPAMICVLSQQIPAYRGRIFAVQDYSAAIENMLLAIVALGYQSCWYEGYVTSEERLGEKMARILGVPDGYELVCCLPVGVAAGEPSPRQKKPFGERAWFNTFPADSADSV